MALTRVPGRPGLVYGVDLMGAAIGSLAILPLLGLGNITSSAFVCGALAAVSSFAFHRFAGHRSPSRFVWLAAVLVVAAMLNSATPNGLRVLHSKGQTLSPKDVAEEYWTIHGQVRVYLEEKDVRPYYWGARWDRRFRVNKIEMVIDGAAGTPMTEWDGRPESLNWVGRDVTSLPYYLRPDLDAAVIGISSGGGTGPIWRGDGDTNS